MRVVRVRTGVVLDGSRRRARADADAVQARRRRPVAGGDQYMPWIHADDLVGIYLAAIDDATGRGPVNVGARSRSRTRCSPRRWGARCTGRRPARSRLRAAAALRRDVRDRRPRASAPCPRRPLELGYAFRAPRPRRGAARRAALSAAAAAAGRLAPWRRARAAGAGARASRRFGGTSSQMITPTKLRSRPVPRPHFSP